VQIIYFKVTLVMQMNITNCTNSYELKHPKCIEVNTYSKSFIERTSSLALERIISVLAIVQIYFAGFAIRQIVISPYKDKIETGTLIASWLIGTFNSILAITNGYYSLK
jgi:hypothetical protein